MVKCPYCPKKFPTHHGLGGHLSGPCGIKLKASKANGVSKPKPKPKRKLKEFPLKVDFGPEMNAELRAQDRAKAQAAMFGKLAVEMRKLADVHRKKAEDLEQMANRMRFLA